METYRYNSQVIDNNKSNAYYYSVISIIIIIHFKSQMSEHLCPFVANDQTYVQPLGPCRASFATKETTLMYQCSRGAYHDSF